MNHFVLFSCLMAMVSGESLTGSTASSSISPKNYQQDAMSAGLLQPTSPNTATAAMSSKITATAKAKITTSGEPESAATTSAAAVNLINHGAEGDMHGADLRNHLLYFGIGCNRNGGGRGEPRRELDREYGSDIERGYEGRERGREPHIEASCGDCCAGALCEGRGANCLGRFCNIFNCANCGGNGGSAVNGGSGVRHDYPEERHRSSGGSCFGHSESSPIYAPNQPPHHRPEPHHNADPHHPPPCADPYFGERGPHHGQEYPHHGMEAPHHGAEAPYHGAEPHHHPPGASLVVNDKTVTHTATRTSTHLSYATSTYTTVITATKTHTDLRYPVETHTKVEHETAYQYPFHAQPTHSPCW